MEVLGRWWILARLQHKWTLSHLKAKNFTKLAIMTLMWVSLKTTIYSVISLKKLCTQHYKCQEVSLIIWECPRYRQNLLDNTKWLANKMHFRHLLYTLAVFGIFCRIFVICNAFWQSTWSSRYYEQHFLGSRSSSRLSIAQITLDLNANLLRWNGG